MPTTGVRIPLGPPIIGMSMSKEFLWTEKYRPQKVSDCVLPEELKNTFSQFVASGNVPNLLLSGGPGIGKTTVAQAMLNELGADHLMINGSMKGNIDTLRNEIMSYASAYSLTGGRKYVILDEADYLNANSTQPALRNFMEEFSVNCGFILTCNYLNRIIEPLHSRCSTIDFNVKNFTGKQAAQFMKRIEYILKEENIEYEKLVIAELIKKHFPDFRKVLNEMQRYASSGKIDAGILAKFSNANIDMLIDALKSKKFTDVRKWVAENMDMDFTTIVRTLYDGAYKTIDKQSIPQLVIILAEYQYKDAFVADKEINTMAMMTEIMGNVEFN